jgi:hypothetical protein
MAESIQLSKTVYGKITYPNVVNTEFTQLIRPATVEVDNSITIDQFFQAYNDLFFEIPAAGDFNSHEELIKRSTEYTGVNQTSAEIDALLEEINQLRLENLSQQQQLDEFNTTK